MPLWGEIRNRRVFPFVGAYLAAGFLALEGVDQAVGHELLPGLAYRLVLVFYLVGVPFASVLAWYHGERGAQKPEPKELWILSSLLVVAIGLSYVVVKDYRSKAADAMAAAEAGLDPTRVAVLYFEDFSEGELAYLADGLTEALIDRLSQVRALDVISRNGVAPYRGTEVTPDSVGRALEAGSLIWGSVEQRGDRFRITARLIDGMSGADVQRESFDLPSGDLLTIQDSLATDVSNFLRERLGDEVRLRERRAATGSPEAWAFVQRAERLRKDGVALLEEGDYDGGFAAWEAADSVLSLAEALDSNWIEPIVLRGQIAYSRAREAESAEEYEDWTATGLSHAERALALEPSDARALELRGTLNYSTWVFLKPADPDEANALLNSARADLEAATNADPTLASAFSTLSHLYYQIPDVSNVVISARRAYEEDAYLDLAPQILMRLFNGSADLEQFAQADRWCLEGARRFPQQPRFLICELRLMTTPYQAPDLDRAWELVAQLDSITDDEYWHIEARMLAGGALARADLPDSARAVLVAARERISHENDPEQELLSVEAYQRTLLGEYDEAVDLLRRYAAANPGHFDESTWTSWWWRALRDHPGFQELTGSRRGS
jgi:serine/threonine-protein kinase